MDKQQIAELEAILKIFGKRCKYNCNGGRVFDMELDSDVRVVINKVLEILNGK